MAEDFYPEELQVQEVDSIRVRFSWADRNGKRQAEVLSKSQLPWVLALIQSQTAAGSGAPINLAALRPGRSIEVTGMQFGSQAGHLVLSTFVHLQDEDRDVIIPLRFNRDDVTSCISEMTRWLAGKF